MAATLTASALADALSYGRRPQVRARWMSTLRHLIALPTFSGSPALEQAASLLANELVAIGMQKCRIIRFGPGAPPSVWAERREIPGAPCLLLYAHFDVQPPGSHPWRRMPFSADVFDERVHGRGASDNKGPLICLLAGLESHLATSGRLPVNVRIWLEGEEEIGSPHLPSFLDRHGPLLKADAIALSDSSRVAGVDRPTLVTGLRGMLDISLTVSGPSHELHSGALGGEVLDPGLVLSQLISSLLSIDRRVRVTGFYDAVRKPTRDELLQNSAVTSRIHSFAESAGVPITGLLGERGWPPGTRSTLRPSLTVVGISAGRTGASAVASIPTSATARINIRLVADQDPRAIACLLRNHFRRVAPPGARYRVKVLASAYPVVAKAGQSFAGPLHRALTKTWGRRPLVIRNGGTIPVVAELHRRFGMPAAMWGLSGPDGRIHASDESFAVDDLRRGSEVVTRLLQEAAQ